MCVYSESMKGYATSENKHTEVMNGEMVQNASRDQAKAGEPSSFNLELKHE